MELQGKQRLKEEKQLAHYKKQRSWKPYALYPIVIVILIIFASAIDEMCSNLNGDLESAIITDFFGNLEGQAYTAATGQFGLFVTLASVSSLICPFYKSLSDKLGRKLFLWLNILGMGIGLFLCYWSPNMYIYLLGYFFISFFICNDMQVVYVFEVAPKEKRASLYGFTKCVGTLSVILIPLLRSQFLKSSDITSWRKVFLIPAILSIVFAILLFFFAKETNVYLDSKIAYLSKPIEQRKQEAIFAKANKKDEKSGVFPAIKYIFTHKSLRWAAITQIAVGFCFYALSNNYTPIMRTFAWSEEDILKALLLFSTIYALSMLLAGLLADKFGRKKVIIACMSIAIPFFVLFVVGADNMWNPYLIGVFMSLYRSGLYISYDYLTLIASELCPTSIRGSIIGAQSLCSYLAVAAGLGITTIVLTKGGLLTGYACLTVGIPFAAIGLFLAIFFLSESKGADLEAIK